jgi:hypothetical protein
MRTLRGLLLTLPCLFLPAALLAPASLSGQGIAVGARAGTLGLGGELAVGLSDVFVLRGGYGVFPYEYDGNFDGEDYTVTFPDAFWSAGIDLYLGGGPIRIMGGVLGRTSDVEISSSFDSREIGGVQFDVPGTITGILKQDAIAPYAGIGFGKHTAGGFGFFLDVGAALAGEANVEMSATGEVASAPGIQEALQQEADNVASDAGGLIKVWPVVSLGIKLPLTLGY